MSASREIIAATDSSVSRTAGEASIEGLGTDPAIERVLRTIIDDVPDRLLLLDLDLTIRFANRAIFDTPRERLPGRSILDFIPDQEHERVRGVYRHALLERAPKVYELRQIVRGELRWFENRVGPVMQAGRVFAFAISSSEITARRRNEEALRVLETEITEIASREQHRIGNDLHDGLGQELTGIALMARSLAARLQKDAHPAAEAAEEIIALVNRAIENTRALAQGLSPVSVERGGLPYALRSLATRSENMYKAKVRFHSKIWPQLTLPANSCGQLYRIAQEAVNNAIKHGQAHEIIIDLQVKGEVVMLAVSDDGCGFPPGAGVTSGLGMKIMQYRASALGGTVTFDKSSSGGARMVCSCRQPVAAEASARRSSAALPKSVQ